MAEPITRQDLESMTAEQISAARKAGELDQLLAPPPEPQYMTAKEGADYLAAGHTHDQLRDELNTRRTNHNEGA